MIQENHIECAIKELFANLRFTAEPAGLYDPLRYMMDIGGKRIRPRLCLTTYSLYKDSFSEEILSPAAALEVFHSFTLIHDDIMDKAPVRRGVPTVYKKWDENTAILSGDVMSIESYKLLAKAPKEALAAALDLFSTTAAQVCEGQQYDMDFEDMECVPMEDYMKMIGLKTAVLIACSAKMGAIIAGASEEECELLYRFGYDLGLAFQIADDLLDTYGELPKAVENLLVIAVLKSYAAKFRVKKISLIKGVGALEFPTLETLGDKRILAAMDKYQGRVRLNMSEAPVIEFFGRREAAELMAEMTKFLKFALTFQ